MSKLLFRYFIWRGYRPIRCNRWHDEFNFDYTDVTLKKGLSVKKVTLQGVILLEDFKEQS